MPLRFPAGMVLTDEELNELRTLTGKRQFLAEGEAIQRFYAEQSAKPNRQSRTNTTTQVRIVARDDQLDALIRAQSEILSELRKPVIPQYDPKTGRLIGAQRK